MKPEYRKLYFGKSDSGNECADNPREFLRSYVDLRNTSRSVITGNQFLVLGPKGTGKSALGWYLQSTQCTGGHIALLRDASTLPLAEVPRLQTGQAPGPERSVSAWTFILLCNYLELLLRDRTCSIHQDVEAIRVVEILRGYGFIGSLEAGRALLKASNTTVRIPISHRGRIYRREGQPDLNIYNLIPYLESWATDVTSSSRHVLLIDGLDSIFLNDRLYDDSLASLVQAAYLLNQRLAGQNATGNVVLLLRNDVFARIALSLPDSQKMRDDLSLELDWRVLSGAAGIGAPLLRLVNAKAAQALEVQDIQVLDYFPENIHLGLRASTPRPKPTLSYLLNLTRHTPRDLLRLFEEIRKIDDSGIFLRVDGKLSEDVIREGVLQYATKYFVGAIRNEFAGVDGGPELASMAIRALQNMGKPRFDRNDFRLAIAGLGENSSTQADKLLRLLFFSGAIGNYVARTNESYLQFYHRRDDAEIYLSGTFVLHTALLHAWAMPHSI